MVFLLLATAAGSSVASFFEDEKLDASVPSPETVIGHSVEEGAVRYVALVDYLEKLTEKARKRHNDIKSIKDWTNALRINFGVKCYK